MSQDEQNPFDEFLKEETTNQDLGEKPMWDALIGKIIDGKVIPVIGPDFLTDGSNIHEQLLAAFAKKYGVMSRPTSFSDLIFDRDYLERNNDNKDAVYTQIGAIVKKEIKPSQLLVDLLETKLFPFVITTSFLPVVEQTMAKVWGEENLRVLKFNNNPGAIEDIDHPCDLLKPTVFYMFGRAGDSAHRYVVTDQDMLDFCSSWLSGEVAKKPVKLINALRDKFLLMLGTDYSDWLFRFVWYSVRKESELKSENNDMISSNAELEDSFIKFMRQNHTFIKNNPEEVVRQINDRMEEEYAKNPLLKDEIVNRVKKFASPEVGVDVFISYSRRDGDFTKMLYETLTNKGANVWYDRENLSAGDPFMLKFQPAIESAKLFVPILSLNIEREIADHHVYRKEWEFAVAVKKGVKFIIPVVEDSFNFKSDISEEMAVISKKDAILYKSINDVNRIADKIINELKKL